MSQELALRLCMGHGHLQFFRLDNGERLLTHAERAEQESRRAEREAAGRRAAEAELERLRQELTRRPPV